MGKEDLKEKDYPARERRVAGIMADEEVRKDSLPFDHSAPASEVAREILQSVLPSLKRHRSAILQERKELGLKSSYRSDGKKIFSYPDPITAREALNTAVEIVGGESYVQSKKSLERLEALDDKAKKTLDEIDSMYRGISKLTPAYFKKQHYLKREQKNIREAYNSEVTRFNKKVEYLNRPETQERVKRVAEALIKDGSQKELQRKDLDFEYWKIEAHLERLGATARKLRSAGDLEVKTKKVSLKVSHKTLSLNLPERKSLQEISKKTQTLSLDGRIKKIKR